MNRSSGLANIGKPYLVQKYKNLLNTGTKRKAELSMKTNELNDKVKDLILNLSNGGADEEEIQKLNYLNNDYWDDVTEKRYELLEEADVLAKENDYYAKSELESIKADIRSYDVLLQNKNKLQRIGYETFLKYEESGRI